MDKKLEARIARLEKIMHNKRVNEDYENDRIIRKTAKEIEESLFDAKHKILDLGYLFADSDDIDEYWMSMVNKIDEILKACNKSVGNYFSQFE